MPDTTDIQQSQSNPNGFSRIINTAVGRMIVNPLDRYVGRSLHTYGEYSFFETTLFNQLVKSGNTVVDIGANIGAHTLTFSKAVGPGGRVFAIEPQRLIFQTLCANLALNGIANVYPLHGAAAAKDGFLHVPELDYNHENNFAGLELGEQVKGMPDHLKEGRGNYLKTRMIALDGLDIGPTNFIKIDVEGMEKQAIEGAAKIIKDFSPILFVENDRKHKSPELITCIESLGYTLFWHIAPMFNAKNFFKEKTNVFPGIVSVNMLCIPPGMDADVQGLKKVTGPDDWWENE